MPLRVPDSRRNRAAKPYLGRKRQMHDIYLLQLNMRAKLFPRQFLSSSSFPFSFLPIFKIGPAAYRAPYLILKSIDVSPNDRMNVRIQDKQANVQHN
jgi:hypothetical protein